MLTKIIGGLWLSMTVAHRQLQGPQWSCKKKMDFFESHFCDCLLDACQWTAHAVWSLQPMQVEKIFFLWFHGEGRSRKPNKCKGTNRCNISHSGAFEHCRLKPTTYIAGIFFVDSCLACWNMLKNTSTRLFLEPFRSAKFLIKINDILGTQVVLTMASECIIDSVQWPFCLQTAHAAALLNSRNQ